MSKGLIIAIGMDDFIAEFAINEIKPKHVAFLVTDVTFSNVMKIVEKCKISSYKLFFIKNIFSTTETIHEFLNAFNWIKGHKLSQLYVEGTNCITVVEMATYVSASILNLYRDVLEEKIDFKLVYVHADFQIRSDGVAGEVRGTEKLVELERPIDSLSFVLAIDAIRAFNKRRYLNAHENFSILVKNTTGDKIILYKGLFHLSLGYEFWDKVNFDEAIKNLELANENFNQVKDYKLGKKLIPLIEKNIIALENLKAQDLKHIIVDLYINALRRENEGRFDDGIGRLYACLERITQFRLKKYNIDTKSPDYSNLSKDVVKKFEEKLGFLPVELELKKNAELLILLDDPIGKTIKEIKYNKFVGLIGVRNQSILAHGISSISKQNFVDFKVKLLEPVLDSFRKVEKMDEKFVEMHKHIRIHDINEVLYKETISSKN